MAECGRTGPYGTVYNIQVNGVGRQSDGAGGDTAKTSITILLVTNVNQKRVLLQRSN
jgi:hypothetical protein